MKIILQSAGLLLTILSISYADNATFTKSLLIKTGAKPLPVELSVSDAGVTIQSKDNKTPLTLDFPYGVIKKLGYTFGDHGKLWLLPVMGASALAVRGQSHWLIIESSIAGDERTILHLDKSEYSGVVAALTAKSGRSVEMLAPGSTLIDPTAASHDEDQSVPFPMDHVLATLKLVMEQYSCKPGKPNHNQIECTRRIVPPDHIGGGERVTATLESNGNMTRIQIKTQKGLGRNWSEPIYLELMRRLQPAK